MIGSLNITNSRMDLLALVLTGLLILLSVYYLGKKGLKRARVVSLIDKLPGPLALPIIGSAYLTVRPRREMLKFVEDNVKKYGTLFRTWAGPIPEVHLMEPEHIEAVLNSMKHLDKAFTYGFLHPWLGTGLLTSTGSKWHSHRKMITPTFHFKILDTFMEIFVEKSEILVEKLKKHLDGKQFDIYPYITRCALDIICETAMGMEINAQQDVESEYVKAVYSMSEITLKRALRPWLWLNSIFYRLPSGKRYKECLQILHGFTKRVIQDRKMILSGQTPVHHESSDEDRLIGKKKRKAFLDLLLEAAQSGDKITDEELREEVDTFMFEGHDTTTAGMNWTLFLLGNHPDVQKRVHEELDQIFGDSDRPARTEDLQNMKYLERVIKESLRLYPSVPFIQRQLTESITIDNYEIPSGTVLTFHIISTHRIPKHFPNPDVFNPDNFLPENIQKRHPYAYVPFSAGPRNCIGQKFALMEEKTVLSYILRNYEIRSIESEAEIIRLAELVLRPENGTHITLKPRKK